MKAAEEEERKAREEAEAKEAAEEACRRAAEEAAELKAKAEAEAKAKAEAEAELAALKKAQEEAEAAALKAKAEAEAKARAEAEAELAALKKAQQEAEAQRIAAEKAAEQAEINIPRGLEEIEPGVAGPATNTAEVNAKKSRRYAHRAFPFPGKESRRSGRQSCYSTGAEEAQPVAAHQIPVHRQARLAAKPKGRLRKINPFRCIS